MLYALQWTAAEGRVVTRIAEHVSMWGECNLRLTVIVLKLQLQSPDFDALSTSVLRNWHSSARLLCNGVCVICYTKLRKL